MPKGIARLVILLICKSRTLFTSIILLMLISFQTYGQDETWKALTTIDGVEISYQKSLCDSNEVLLIKAVNTNDQTTSLNLVYSFTSKVDNSIMGKGDLNEIVLEANAETASACGGTLSINVYDHFSMFNEEEFTIIISKSE